MGDRPRILFLVADSAHDSDLIAIYLGRFASRIDYDVINRPDQLTQWLGLERVAHQAVIITPLPWRWAAPTGSHLVDALRSEKNYRGPIIIVSNTGEWWRPLLRLASQDGLVARQANGPALVPNVLGELFFPEPTAP